VTLVGALRARLLAVPAVTALVADRIYALEFPQSLTAPALRLHEVDRLSAMQLRGDVVIRRARVQIDAVENEAHGDPYATVHQLSSAVRGDLTTGVPSGLVGFRGDLSGVEIDSILAADERELYDAETRLVRVEQDLFVWFRV
jgi:hypothetical protein